MSIEQRTVSALKWTAGARLIGQAVSWLVTLVVVRILAPTDYGLMALVSVVVSVAAGLAELGIGASLIQARQLETAVIAKVATLVWLLHLVLGVLLGVGAPLMAWSFAEPRLTPLLQVTALQFAFIALGAVPQALAARTLKFRWLSGVECASGVAGSVMTLVMALGGLGVWALVLGNLFGTALRGVLLATGGGGVWPDLDMRGIGRHLDYGVKISGGRLGWLLINQADILLGSRLMSREALGVYSVSVHLATLPMQRMMGIINQVAFPAVARLQEDRERLKRRLLQACRMLTAVNVPVLWGVAAVAPEFVAVVCGPKWAEAVRPLQLMALAVPLRMVGGIFNTAVGGIGRAATALWNTLTTAVVWPACFLVGGHWGAEGLAASWLVAVPITFVVNVPRTSAWLGVAFRDVLGTLLRPMLAGVLMVTSIAGARLLLPEWPLIVRTVALVATGAGVYIGMLLLLDRGMWAELRQLAFARIDEM